MVFALLIGAVSGLLAFFAGMPLPWMLGSMVGVTLVALFQGPVAAPLSLRGFVIPVIGVMLGSAITAETLQQAWLWSTAILLLPVALIGAAIVSYLVYRRMGGYDQITAFYAAMPGGLNEMLMLGEEAGGNGRQIALAHAARVMLVILYVAILFGLILGVTSGTSAGAWTALTDLTLRDYAILIACAVAGVPLAKLVRLPAAPVFGPLILSGIAHVAAWVTLPPPSVAVIAAQIVVGTIIGCRFLGTTWAEVGRDLRLAAVGTGAMLVVTTGAAVALVTLADIPFTQSFLAYAPGGLTEMALLTLAVGQDVAFVSVIHIVRITVVIGAAPALFRLWQRLST